MTRAGSATAFLLALTASCGSSGAGPTSRVEPCFPRMSNPEPNGTLPSGTTAVTLRMRTDRNARCRYSAIEGLRYIEMENAFAETGGLEHATPLTGIGPGPYHLFAKCEVFVDVHTDCATPHDLFIRFAIAD